MTLDFFWDWRLCWPWRPFALWQISHHVLNGKWVSSWSSFSAELHVKGTWCTEVPELAERDLLDSLLPIWFFLNLKWFCHQYPQWCWMLTERLRSWTKGLTIEDDDLEHSLEEPNLMHSSDFDDCEEVLCADAAEGCTFLEDELEDDCDEWHRGQWFWFLTSSNEGDVLDT